MFEFFTKRTKAPSSKRRQVKTAKSFSPQNQQLIEIESSVMPTPSYALRVKKKRVNLKKKFEN